MIIESAVCNRSVVATVKTPYARDALQTVNSAAYDNIGEQFMLFRGGIQHEPRIDNQKTAHRYWATKIWALNVTRYRYVLFVIYTYNICAWIFYDDIRTLSFSRFAVKTIDTRVRTCTFKFYRNNIYARNKKINTFRSKVIKRTYGYYIGGRISVLAIFGGYSPRLKLF